VGSSCHRPREGRRRGGLAAAVSWAKRPSGPALKAGARAGLRGLCGCWAGGAVTGRKGWVGLEGGKRVKEKEKGFSIFGKGVSSNRIQI
jgi:hypothetical protein